jgi:hypothetical protein
LTGINIKVVNWPAEKSINTLRMVDFDLGQNHVKTTREVTQHSDGVIAVRSTRTAHSVGPSGV